MRKNLYALILFLIIIAGCAKEADLTIYNDTGQTITVKVDHIIYQMYPNSEPIVNTYYLNSFIFFGETVKVPVEYVETLYLSHKKFNVTMKPNKDRKYHVTFDRAGLQLRNISPGITIDKVQLREVDSDEWSDDLYDGYLLPEEIDTFPVPSGIFYMRIEDVYGVQYLEELIEFIAGETFIYFFDGQMVQ